MPSKPKNITAEMLRSRGACEDQVAIFEKAWPDGMVPNLRALRRAARLGLNLEWAARQLLTATAWKAYEEARTTALEAYEEATAPAWKAYEEATATARKAYKEAMATALCAAWQKM